MNVFIAVKQERLKLKMDNSATPLLLVYFGGLFIMVALIFYAGWKIEKGLKEKYGRN